MKIFLEEYGLAILTAVVVILLITLCTPVGKIEYGEAIISQDMLDKAGGKISLILRLYVVKFPEQQITDFGDNAQILNYGIKLIK